MSKSDYPSTSAIRALKQMRIPFIPHFYTYEERGGTKHSSESLGVPEHNVVKTLVMQTDERKPLIVLMHGDRDVSTKQLARVLGVKSIEPCDERTAERHTGYQFGGTSPFGTRTRLPVFVESTILLLDRIYINGGKRGFLIEINPALLNNVVQLTSVSVAIEK